MAAKSGKRKKSTRKTKAGKQEQGFLRDEITIWITLAVSIVLLISNFGMGGFVGEAISSVLERVFGWAAYVFPFFLFGMITFIVSNKGNFTAYLKTITSILLLIFCCTFLQLLNDSGGLLGNVLASLLAPAIGIVGTYAVTIIMMIVCLVVITGKSALKGVKSQGGKAYDKAKKDALRRREIAGERKAHRIEDREQSGRRTAHHVSGVSFDTSIAKKSPDVKELSVEANEPSCAGRPLKEHNVEEPQFVINRGEPAALDEEVLPFDEGQAVHAASAGGASAAPVAGAAALGGDMEAGTVSAGGAKAQRNPRKAYKFPPISLLTKGKKNGGESDASLQQTAVKLQKTLQNFGVRVTITNVSCGPSVTRYELQPEMGVKVSRIVGLADDIKLNLAAADIRIEAPIPGKAAVGIEVPNKENSLVMLRDLLESREFKSHKSRIAFAAGKDIGGKAVVADIAKMPHLLVAGATGSGKSVCINTLIMSILYKATPDEVKLIMIDPKVVELSVYNGIPHLMIPVVTDPKKAAGALNWAVAEMTRRYQAFADYNVRDIKGYNDRVGTMPDMGEEKPVKMPQIVIIVDELADLMMVAPGDVEEAICRLAQLARAAGVHLVLATQRPSVNVITGLIKANMPSRIAFSVSSGVDSRTIIDMNGAEKLLGKGDMLFYPSGYQKPARVQGAFVSDKEVQSVTDYLKAHNEDAAYDEEIETHVNTAVYADAANSLAGAAENGADACFAEAGQLIIDKDKASIGMLQRAFKIGFNRAARIMDQLCEAGVVGGEEGTKPRKVLMTAEEFAEYINGQK